MADQRTALHAMLTSLKSSMDNSCSYSIRKEGVELEDSTGALVGSWAESSTKVGTGTDTSEPMADAAQVLYRWKTGEVIGGRFLQGRTFFPGVAVTNEAGGNLSAGAVTTFAGYGTTLVGSGAGLVVWHRPIAGSGGTNRLVTSCTVWAELAVLRRRRK